MGNTNIAVRIYGTPASNAGFEPIAIVNYPIFPALEHQGVPGMDKSAPYYLLHTDADYIQYTAVMENVQAAGASQAGMLKVAISIPKDFAVASGQSPYTVLEAVRDTFVRRHMVCVNGIYHFAADIPLDVVTEEVQQALGKFTLTPCSLPWRPMTGKDPALLLCPANMMGPLMKDIQYREFVKYKEVVVAERHKDFKGDNLTDQLTVPRKPAWKVAVNNKRYVIPPEGLKLSVCKALDISPDYFEDRQVLFRAEDIVKKNLPPLATLDIQNETVVWSPQKTVKSEFLPKDMQPAPKIVITDIEKSLQKLYDENWEKYWGKIWEDGVLEIEVRDAHNLLRVNRPVSKGAKVELSLSGDWSGRQVTIDLPQLRRSKKLMLKRGQPTEVRLDAFTDPMESKKQNGNHIIQWVLIFVLGLFLGGVVGHFVWTTSGAEQQSAATGKATAKAEPPTIINPKEEAIKKNIEEYKQILASDDLTFAQVDSIMGQVKQQSEEYQQIDKEFYLMILEYDNVVRAIRTTTKDYHSLAMNIGLVQGKIVSTKTKIHDNHLEMMRTPFVITDKRTNKDVDKAVWEYERKHTSFTSFKDFKSLMRIYQFHQSSSSVDSREKSIPNGNNPLNYGD